jgi:hypothetical protein
MAAQTSALRTHRQPLDAHPPALDDRIGEAGGGRKFLIILDLIDLMPVPYARQYLWGVLQRAVAAGFCIAAYTPRWMSHASV